MQVSHNACVICAMYVNMYVYIECMSVKLLMPNSKGKSYASESFCVCVLSTYVLCMYVCKHLRTYMHIRIAVNHTSTLPVTSISSIHTYIHTYIQIYIHYSQSYQHSRSRLFRPYIHTYMHACTYTYIHTYIAVNLIDTPGRVNFVHTYIHTFIHTCTYTHIHCSESHRHARSR
jgi:hypothetical protein